MALSSVEVERRNAPEASAEPDAPAPNAAASLSRRYALRAASKRFLRPFSIHCMPTRSQDYQLDCHVGASWRTNLLLNYIPLLPYLVRKYPPHFLAHLNVRMRKCFQPRAAIIFDTTLLHQSFVTLAACVRRLLWEVLLLD